MNKKKTTKNSMFVLGQNTMKRPFYYSENPHYNGPQLLHRYEVSYSRFARVYGPSARCISKPFHFFRSKTPYDVFRHHFELVLSALVTRTHCFALHWNRTHDFESEGGGGHVPQVNIFFNSFLLLFI